MDGSSPRAAISWWPWVSVLTFAVSLAIPAFCLSNRCVYGWEALLEGWLQLLLHPPAGLCWLANLAIVFAWAGLFQSARDIALPFATGAFVLAASFLAVHGVATDEGGSLRVVLSYQVGYWAWVASAAAACAGAWLLPRPRADGAG